MWSTRLPLQTFTDPSFGRLVGRLVLDLSRSSTRCERRRVVGHGQCQHVTNAAHAPRLPDRVGVPHTPCSRSATGHRELLCPTAFPCRDPVRLGMRGSPGSPDERYAHRCPVPSGVLPGSSRENSPRHEPGGHHEVRPSRAPARSRRGRSGIEAGAGDQDSRSADGVDEIKPWVNT